MLFAYGEERKSRRIAHSIVAARATQPIAPTTELARLIEKTIGRKPGGHPSDRRASMKSTLHLLAPAPHQLDGALRL